MRGQRGMSVVASDGMENIQEASSSKVKVEEQAVALISF